MMLQLHELGLGSTWVGFFDPVAIKEAYNIPDNLEAISILPVGYPSQDSKPSPMHTTRKELSEIVFYNKF
ncbi:Nitroreductase family protein [compost metagenome]